MPYIPTHRRWCIDPALEQVIDEVGDWGETNYAITTLLHGLLHGASYEDYQAAIGLLECAKLELYRRVVSTYEDLKIEENGDLS